MENVSTPVPSVHSLMSVRLLKSLSVLVIRLFLARDPPPLFFFLWMSLGQIYISPLMDLCMSLWGLKASLTDDITHVLICSVK